MSKFASNRPSRHHNHIDGLTRLLVVDKGVAGHSRSHKNGNYIFNGKATGYHGGGGGATHRFNTAAARPFSSTTHRLHNNPFTPAQQQHRQQHKQRYDYLRACLVGHDGKPLYDANDMPDSFYLKYLSQLWDGTSKLHPVTRSRALARLLDVGSVDEVCAEVFHFISGVLQCEYGDGYMRDDLSMCDCNGTVPVCFMRAYLYERQIAEEFRQRAELAESLLRSNKATPSTSSVDGHDC